MRRPTGKRFRTGAEARVPAALRVDACGSSRRPPNGTHEAHATGSVGDDRGNPHRRRKRRRRRVSRLRRGRRPAGARGRPGDADLRGRRVRPADGPLRGAGRGDHRRRRGDAVRAGHGGERRDVRPVDAARVPQHRRRAGDGPRQARLLVPARDGRGVARRSRVDIGRDCRASPRRGDARPKRRVHLVDRPRGGGDRVRGPRPGSGGLSAPRRRHVPVRLLGDPRRPAAGSRVRADRIIGGKQSDPGAFSTEPASIDSGSEYCRSVVASECLNGCERRRRSLINK